MTPKTSGRNEIEQEIGQGAMATVRVACDPLLTRAVAGNGLAPQLMIDTLFACRLRREAEIIATLEHAVSVPLYNFGEDAD